MAVRPGALPSGGGDLFGGDRVKRIFSLFMAMFCVVISFLPIIIYSRATPAAGPLLASALYSYVASSGIRLWREGTQNDLSALGQLEDDINDLWDRYSPNSDMYSSLNGGVSISAGQFVFDYTILPQVQGFVDWISETFDLKPLSTTAITNESEPSSAALFTLPADEASELWGYETYWALPVSASSSDFTFSIFNSNDKKISDYIFSGASYSFSIGRRAYVIGLNDITREYISYNSAGEPGQPSYNTYTPQVVFSDRVTRPNTANGSFVFTITSVSPGSTAYLSPMPPGNTVINNGNVSSAANRMAYVILAGDRVGGADDLFASVGSSVLNNTYDLVRDKEQDIAVSVGVGADVTDDELVDIVADSYVAGDVAVPDVQPVATPVPISGVSELYPQVPVTDVDNLGLPALGQALTTRFPFCIPFDIVSLYKSLNASPVRPVVEIDVLPASLKSKIGITESTSFIFDFGDEKYAIIIKIVRWSCLVGFIFFLASQTKRLIWTTGG